MRILTALDRSEYAEIVLEHGLDQAAREPDAELHFVTVVDDDREADEARYWLAQFVAEGLDAFDLGDRMPVLHVRRGRPAPVVATLAAALAADLLVVGRFHVPSAADTIVDLVDAPTLVVDVDGHVLEPQCRACRAVRRDTDGEYLFCDEHAGDRIPNLVARVPPPMPSFARMW